MLNSSARQIHNLDQIRIKLDQSIDITILYMCIKFERIVIVRVLIPEVTHYLHPPTHSHSLLPSTQPVCNPIRHLTIHSTSPHFDEQPPMYLIKCLLKFEIHDVHCLSIIHPIRHCLIELSKIC